MVQAHYYSILERSRSSFRALSEDEPRIQAFTAAHNDAEELDQLKMLLSGRPEEEIFKLALVEYQHALFSAAFGQYRQAHISLRLFLELSLCCVQFSAHEIDARRWLKGEKDSNWSAIISNETGVLSKSLVGVFFEPMKDSCGQYRAIAETLYRECSEYVHGNRQSYDGIDAEISFAETVFDSWIDRAEAARLVVKFAFLCRFLAYISADGKRAIEALALGNFGNLPAVQSIFEGAPE